MFAIQRRGIGRLALVALVSVTAALFAACTSKGGGTGGFNPQPGEQPPSIFGLSKSSANPGEQLDILGSFGTSRDDGTVTIGGIAFTVVSWSATDIKATVPTGAASGIVVVTRHGQSSSSGQEAQLYVGLAPASGPVLYTVTPDFGHLGQDVVSIVGTALGAFDAANNAVFFTASAASDPGTGFVQATVVNNPASGNPQWTSTNIKVVVPAGAASGVLYVKVGTTLSNQLHFEVLPPLGELSDPIISTITPLSGPVTTEITIAGAHFGHSQGNSTVSLDAAGTANDHLLNVLEWTDTQINATIPVGAVTGKILVLVGGKSIEFPDDFTVANFPVITGVAPSDLRIGQSLTVFGHNFGASGTLTIGGTAVPVSTWSPSELDITTLPTLNPNDGNPAKDGIQLNILVQADDGLQSDPFEVNLVSDLIGQVTISPKTGIATKTVFHFAVSVAGGSGSYSFTLYPDAANPGTTKVQDSSVGTVIDYTYPAGGTFNTQVKVKDNTTGDQKILNGPTVVVGQVSDVVVTSTGPLDFGRGAELAENTETRIYTNGGTTISYSGFTPVPQLAVPQNLWFTASIDLLSDTSGNPLPQFTRDQGSFLATAPTERPYGYRHGASGGLMRISGYNFGTAGEIWLASPTGPGTGVLVPVANIVSWNVAEDGTGNPADPNAEGWIDFALPTTGANLNGDVYVRNTTTSKSGKNADPLVVSPLVSVSPASVSDAASLAILGYDFTAPQIQDVSGAQTYIFWVVQATYMDPFTSTTVTNSVLDVNPIPVTVTNGNQINFAMNQLGTKANIEAYDATGAQYQVVQNANLVFNKNYSYFLWSGALPADGSAPGALLANSGTMSELTSIMVNP